MMSRFHMQDQIENRIDELSDDSHELNLEEVLQNIVTLSIVTVFLFLGLSW